MFCLWHASPDSPGSTRDNFEGRPVATLVYAAYGPRALRTMRDIATDVRTKHGMLSVAVVHRLGTVPIGEDSILIAASAPHRQAAWRGAEECLERVKERVEVWKQEVFAADGARGTEDAEGVGAAANAAVAEGGERVWRANCGTTASGKPVPAATTAPPLETSEDGKSTQRS